MSKGNGGMKKKEIRRGSRRNRVRDRVGAILEGEGRWGGMRGGSSSSVVVWGGFVL